MLQSLTANIRTYPKRSYAAGTTVLYQGEAPRQALVLSKGIVRVFGISDQGEEQIVTFHIEGEFFPTSWVFGKSPGTMFFYEAVTDCEVVSIPREELVKLLAEPTTYPEVIDYFTTSYSASLIRTYGLEQSKARQKIIFTMYYLCERYGTKKGPMAYIQLRLTHQTIAAMVGLTRETTSSEMSKLKKLGVVRYTGQRYIINYEKLMDMMGEESFRGIRISSGVLA